MHLTKNDIDRFHEFALAKLTTERADLTWRSLFEDWLATQSTAAQRQELNAIIEQGITDIDAGRGRDAEKVHAELQGKYGLN